MTKEELRQRQQWTLSQKIDHSLGVIDQFLSHTKGKAYVAFSGGKDSTVLLHLARILKPDVPAVFVNTMNEYPEVIKFVRQIREEWGGVVTLYPKKGPRQVWEEVGFPIGSKDIAKKVSIIRNNPNGKTAQRALADNNSYYALKRRWHYLLKAGYDVSARCCDILKKEPSHRYERETGNSPLIGIMASDSQVRENAYLKRESCNSFTEGNYSSWPLAIWNDTDIWAYIKDRHLPYASIYDKGVDRTGCVSCGFGAGEVRDDRLRVLYDLHPKYYEYVMNIRNNGIPYRKALRDMFFQYRRYLPDECPL